jgi:hypothetical protein
MDELTPSIDLKAASPTPVQPRNRGPLIGLAVLVGLGLFGGGAYAVQRWISTTNQAAARAIPASVDLYVGFDAVRFVAEDTQQLMDTITKALATAMGDDHPAGMVEELDRALGDELGVDFSHDVASWLGRSMGVGIDFAPDLTPEVVLAAEVRDEAALDAFLAQIPAQITDTDDEGVSLYESGDDPIAVARREGLLLVGTEAMVRGSLELDPADSLAESGSFLAVTDALAPGRFLTVYGDDDLGSLRGALADTGLAQAAPAFESMGLGATAGETGLVLDFAMVLGSGSTAELWEPVEGQFIEALPASTLAFVQWASLADYWEALRISDADQLVQEGLAEAGDQLGVDLERDLIRRLDRAAGVAVLPDSGGPLPVGVVAAFGTSSPADLRATLDIVVSGIRDLGALVSRQGDLYVAEGEFAFGVVGDWLLAATSIDDAAAFGSGGLAEDSGYQAALAALPDGYTSISLYADVEGLMSAVGADAAVQSALSPIQAVVAGTKREAALLTGALVIMIE